MKKTGFLIILIFSAVFVQGQNRRSDDVLSLEELQRRMMELQRDMFREFRDSPFRDFFSIPDSPGRDSAHSYSIDTTLGDGSRLYFHRFFGPMMENDSLGDNGDFFRSFGRMFEELDRLGEAPGVQRFDRKWREDNSDQEPEDGTLPEEGLRMDREKRSPTDPNAPKPDKPGTVPEKKKSKIKTERL